MPKKKKKKSRLDEYDLHEAFKREASDAVQVMFHTKDPGYALSARVYPGNAAHSMLQILEPLVEGAGQRLGWDEQRIRRAVEEDAQVAFVIFTQQLQDKLSEALHELVFEAVAQTMRAAARGAPGQDDPDLVGETEWFNLAMKVGDELKRRRLSAPQRGPKADWTPERRAEFLRHYDEILGQVKGAKRIFRGDPLGKGWRDAARRAFPSLPESILDKIPSRAYKPSDLAREGAAEVMGLSVSEYLSRVLVLARREASEISEND